MNRILAFIMQSRINTTLVATMGLLFPLLNIATNSIVGLVVLRHGTSNGILVLIAATVITVATTGWFSSPLAVIMMALTTGIPILILAAMLRNTSSLSLSLCSGALLTAAGLLLIEWITGDSQGWWRSLLEYTLLSGVPDTEVPEISSEMIDLLALPFTKLPIAVFITTVFALLIARWCHARLDNPGGFANEYRHLRLSSTMAIVAIGLSGWALNGEHLLLDDLMYVAVVLFFFHGIAIVHAVVAGRKESHVWVVLMYFIIILVPLSIVLMALIGLSDVWLDYRKKLSSGY